MAIPYSYGTSFDTARCTQCWKEFPFAKFGDSATTVYHHIMVMNGDEYAPPALDTTLTASSTKPLGSLFADDSTAYFVEDKDTALALEPLAPFSPSTPILDTAKSNLTFLPVTYVPSEST